MIKVRDLKKTYPGHVPVKALKGVSFDVSQGEFIAIMGPSGSGKSTLLHQLALLDEPTSGQILLDGIDVSTLSDRQRTDFRLRHLGYVFQEYALHPRTERPRERLSPADYCWECAEESISIPPLELMRKVGLGDRLHHLISQLSGGEQQRVAIARALVNKSKILFADEPCANLDTENKGIVLRLLRKLCDELGQTILMVTHEPEQREFTDRVIWLRDGLIEKQETVTIGSRQNTISNAFRTDISPGHDAPPDNSHGGDS